MTQSFYWNKRLDVLLETFLNATGGCIEKKTLLNKTLKDLPEALAFLVAEGYLEESKYYFKITYKGKAFINQGGFTRQYRRESIQFYCTIIAAISGVIGLLFSVFALCS